MKTYSGIIAAVLVAGASGAALAQDVTVGVSWSNFQEERWKTDEAAIKAALDAAGAAYISADAQSNSSKQLADIESLIASGADALIVLAQDAAAVGPAVDAAANEGIPVIAYDRLIEDPRAFYLTFDNVEVGRMQARAVLEQAPEGNYVMIKGSSTDANADFLRGGQQEVLQEAIDAGKVTDRRRGLHRRLAAGQRPAQHGADPHPAEQRGRRRRRLERRHRRRRRRGADRAGHGGHPGLRSGRRRGGLEPHRPRHPDRLGLEGRPRARQALPARSPWRWPAAPPSTPSRAPARSPRPAATR